MTGADGGKRYSPRTNKSPPRGVYPGRCKGARAIQSVVVEEQRAGSRRGRSCRLLAARQWGCGAIHARAPGDRLRPGTRCHVPWRWGVPGRRRVLETGADCWMGMAKTVSCINQVEQRSNWSRVRRRHPASTQPWPSDQAASSPWTRPRPAQRPSCAGGPTRT